MKRFLLRLAVAAAVLSGFGAIAQAGHGHKFHSHGHSHRHLRVNRPVLAPIVTVPQIHYDVVPHFNSRKVHLDVVPHFNTVPFLRLNSGHHGR